MAKKLSPILPGGILEREFLIPLNISQNMLAREICVPPPSINAIVRGKRRITPDMALRFARFFRTTPQMWLNLQQRYDLLKAQDMIGDEIEKRIRPIPKSKKEAA
jgi:antitoxin HigA-1